MQLRLRPVHARLNEGDFDAQRFALANNTPLQGRILKQTAVSDRCDSRWRFILWHRDRTRLLAHLIPNAKSQCLQRCTRRHCTGPVTMP